MSHSVTMKMKISDVGMFYDILHGLGFDRQKNRSGDLTDTFLYKGNYILFFRNSDNEVEYYDVLNQDSELQEAVDAASTEYAIRRVYQLAELNNFLPVSVQTLEDGTVELVLEDLQ